MIDGFTDDSSMFGSVFKPNYNDDSFRCQFKSSIVPNRNSDNVQLFRVKKRSQKSADILRGGGSDELKTQKTQKEEKSSWKFQNISVIRIQIMCRNLTVVDPQSHTGNL